MINNFQYFLHIGIKYREQHGQIPYVDELKAALKIIIEVLLEQFIEFGKQFIDRLKINILLFEI